jgi:hypothetical protein
VNGTTASQMNQSSCGNSHAESSIYHVFIYTNNQLKYANFHWSNYSWSPYNANAWDKQNKNAALAIYSGLASQGAILNSQQANAAQSSPGTWVTNFLNSYSSEFTSIQSADVTFYTVASRTDQCNGGYAVWQNYVRYFTPQ